MALSSSKLFPILFLLITLLSSLHHTLAIDTQEGLPYNEQPPNTQQEQEQHHFLPENDGNQYGLYQSYPATTEQQPPQKHDYYQYYYDGDDQNLDNRNYKSYYYNGGRSFNLQPQGVPRYHRDRYFNRGGIQQRQGMSDTRFLENGKYFYDVNTESFSMNHPYEVLKNFGARNVYDSGNYYENGFGRGSSIEGYQGQNDQFLQDGQNHNMP